MKPTTAATHKIAIGLSAMCTIHCLALPLVLALVPSMAALGLDNEAFHLWMVLAVIPTSVYALTMGCKQHKRYRVVVLGGAGLGLLATAVLLGESAGELGEKLLTVAGASLVAFGHLWNYRLCQQPSDCACPTSSNG
ncbi:MerC domain-containing protein [Microbulbifer sp. HZ11]|uniref:MerC domain-containing protein n=1 Tax=Microbulbifer sp. HZ11 TaxID=1453501 RepID=UPI0005BDBBCA|nr:MerC domain-containing protein [Microbulbifer sp. HZ11]